MLTQNNNPPFRVVKRKLKVNGKYFYGLRVGYSTLHVNRVRLLSSSDFSSKSNRNIGFLDVYVKDVFGRVQSQFITRPFSNRKHNILLHFNNG